MTPFSRIPPHIYYLGAIQCSEPRNPPIYSPIFQISCGGNVTLGRSPKRDRPPRHAIRFSVGGRRFSTTLHAQCVPPSHVLCTTAPAIISSAERTVSVRPHPDSGGRRCARLHPSGVSPVVRCASSTTALHCTRVRCRVHAWCDDCDRPDRLHPCEVHDRPATTVVVLVTLLTSDRRPVRRCCTCDRPTQVVRPESNRSCVPTDAHEKQPGAR